MVERAKRKVTRPDSRDYFDWTTPNLDVVAHPTDPIVTPVSPETLQLAQALGVAIQGIGAYKQYKDIKNVYDYKEGYQARQKGEARPMKEEKKTAAYIRGWEEMNGEALAIEFEKEATNLTNDLREKDPITFKEAYAELFQKYVHQLGTDNETKGFLSRFNEIDYKVQTTYNKYQQAYQKQLKYEKLNSIFNDDLTLNITQILGVPSLTDFYNDPLEYLKYAQNPEAFKEQIAPQLREYLTKAFEKYGDTLTKQEISALFLENVAGLAKKYDMPDLLEYAYLKDKHNISVYDNAELKQIVDSSYAAAQSGFNTKLKQINAELKRQNEEYVNRKQNEITFRIALLQPNDQEKAKEILTEILTDDRLMADPSTRTLANSLEEILEGSGHPVNSDTILYDQIQHKLLTETLKERDLLKAKYSLSREDYEGFWNELKEQARRIQSRNEALGLTTAKLYAKRRQDVINAIKSDAEAVDTLMLSYTQGTAISPSLINRLHLRMAELEAEKGWISEEDMEEKIIKPFQEEIAIIKQQLQEAIVEEEETQKKGKKAKKNTNNEKVPPGYIKTNRVDPKTGKPVYQKPDGTYVILGE